MIQNREQWYTNELKSLEAKKIRQYQITKVLNSKSEWAKYKIIRNKYKNKINNAKNNYTKNKIESSSDQKTMWKNIRKYILRKKMIRLKKLCLIMRQLKVI